MKNLAHHTGLFSLQLVLLILSLTIETTSSDSRIQSIELKCGKKKDRNTTSYVDNFVKAMEDVNVQMRSTGFGKSVAAQEPCYGFGQCYGDLSLQECAFCYAEGRNLLPLCFPFNSGRVYLDGCFMRVENYDFFEEFKGPSDKAVCGNKTRKGLRFQESVRKAVVGAAEAALYNGGFARAEVRASGLVNESAFVLVNCWRTLNLSSCKACLDCAAASVQGCLPWSEGRALNVGCFMRYSDTNFLNEEQRNGHSKGSKRVILVIIASSVAVVVIGAAIGVYVLKQRRLQKKRRGLNDAVKVALHNSLNFKYSTLQKATRSFDDENKVGQGGFGTVYKGVLADGREIAVKRLFINNRHRTANFYNEVNVVSSVQHKNLVRLLGCSCSGPESLLVYEFLPNLSLDRFLFDPNKGKSLNWEKRFEIIVGTAEGLAYLHENPKVRIIHRDIKAGNILLDAKLRAKIADFGLARSFQEDKSHISTTIAGTLGYMAPEYLVCGKLTEKADVYSFGVLLLEIVTGIQNNKSMNSEYSDSLVVYAWNRFKKGITEELLDPNLNLHDCESEIKGEISRVIHVGLLCAQEVPYLRPSMSRALRMLLKKDEQLCEPISPPFIDERTMEFNDSLEGSQCHTASADNSSPSVATMHDSSFHAR